MNTFKVTWRGIKWRRTRTYPTWTWNNVSQWYITGMYVTGGINSGSESSTDEPTSDMRRSQCVYLCELQLAYLHEKQLQMKWFAVRNKPTPLASSQHWVVSVVTLPQLGHSAEPEVFTENIRTETEELLTRGHPPFISDWQSAFDMTFTSNLSLWMEMEHSLYVSLVKKQRISPQFPEMVMIFLGESIFQLYSMIRDACNSTILLSVTSFQSQIVCSRHSTSNR
jgi:hypothetical protein